MVCLAIGISLSVLAYADAGINIEASINPARLSVGESAQLSIVVTGAGSGLQTPQLPKLDNFQFYSQSHSEELSFVNGQRTSRSIFTFILIPNTAGKHVINQIQVPINGRIYKTGVLEVEVLDGGRNSNSNSPSNQGRPPSARIVPAASGDLPPEYMTGEEIFVRPWVDRDEVYINQPIYLTYTMYTRASATFKGFDSEPITTGFWVEDFPPQGLATRHEKQIGGHRYVIADVRSIALFPTEAGVIEITPGDLKVDVEITSNDPFSSFYSRDIFGRRRYVPRAVSTQVESRILKTDPIKILVKPMPDQGKPNSFSGAVGHYTLDASASSTEVEEGEAITLRVRLAGEGNLNTVSLPKVPLLDHFKFYEATSSLNLVKDRYIVEGEKIEETVLIPKKAGDYTIPALEYSYFDPKTEKYVTLKTKSIQIKVKGAPHERLPAFERQKTNITPKVEESYAAPALHIDIHYLKDSIGVLPAGATHPFLNRWFWIWHLAAVSAVFILLILAKLIELIFKRGQGASRISHRVAKQKLKSAKVKIKSGYEKEFYEAIYISIYEYFSGKLNIEMGAVGVGLIEARLQHKISNHDMRRLKRLFSEIDFGRFSTAHTSVDDMRALYKEADDMISTIERQRL